MGRSRRAGIVLAILALACRPDRILLTGELSTFDGQPLNAKVMKSLRESEQGCFFSIPAANGGRRVLDLRGKRLPFALPSVVVDPITGRGNGRSVQIMVNNSGLPEAVTIDCWVPSDMAVAELAWLVSDVKWNALYARLRHARIATADELAQPVSREVLQYADEMLQKPVPALTTYRPPAARATSQQEQPEQDFVKRASTTNAATATPIASVPVEPSHTEWELVCGDPYVDEAGDTHIVCKVRIVGAQDLPTITVVDTRPTQPENPWPEIYAKVEIDWCGYLGCAAGGSSPLGGGGQLDLSLTATFNGNDSTAGQTVYFLAQAPWEEPPPGTQVNWAWTSNTPGDQTTIPGSCYNNLFCSAPVYADGRMDVTVVNEEFSGFAFTQVLLSVACTSGPELDDLNALRSEYRDKGTDINGGLIEHDMPACSDFSYQPNGSLFSWPTIRSSGVSHSYAIYRQTLDIGLSVLNSHTPITISGGRIYTTPTRQLEVNPSAPNSRHIYGDAADIDAADVARYNTIREAAISYTAPRPCVEPFNANNPHAHIDYRTAEGAVRRIPPPCPNDW